MLEIIKELVRDLIVVVFLATVLELLMPKSDLKRYIRMVIGLVVILIILSPLNRIFSLFLTGEQPLFNSWGFSVETYPVDEEQERYEEHRQQLVLEMFQERLLGEINGQLAYHNLKVINEELSVIGDPQHPRFGALEKVWLLVAPLEEGIEQPEKVENVRILVEIEQEDEETKEKGRVYRMPAIERELALLLQVAPEIIVVEKTTA